MRKLMMYGLAAIFAAATMASCTPGNNTGGATMTGAALGGLLGGAITQGDNKWAGALAGALIGGAVGNQVGKKMDAQDKANMQSAITTTPVNQQAQWTNQQTDITYKVTPVKEYKTGDQYCREYTTSVKVDDQWQDAHGTACREPDGTWKIAS